MNCKKWLELSLQKKIEMIGKITHLVQNYETGFDTVNVIIEAAEHNGIFKEVVINPTYDCKLCRDTKKYPNNLSCPACVGRYEDIPFENDNY
jgi:hypothetical protein